MKTTDDSRNNGSFWPAVNAAKKITERNPDKDQLDEYRVLVTAMGKLDSESQQAVVWWVINDVLGGTTTTQIQAAFAVARIVRPQMTHLVHNAAVVNQLVMDGVELSTLISLGLAEIRTKKGGNPRVVYKIGVTALEEAAQKLKSNGEAEMAGIVSRHLRKQKEFQLLAEARRTTRSVEATEQAETVSSADTDDETDLVVVGEPTVPKDKTPKPDPPKKRRKKKT